MARPTLYTPELGQRICERIALGETLTRVCSGARMPHRATLFRWLTMDGEQFDAFRDLYARSREQCADSLFDKAMTASADTDRLSDPKLVPGARLYVDTLKWAAAKLRPRSYSDKLQLEHSGGQTMTVKQDLSALTDEELEALERIHAKLADTPPTD